MKYTISNIREGQITISARVVDNAGRISEIATKTVEVAIVEVPEDNEDDNDNNDNNNENDDNNNNGNNDNKQEENNVDNTTSNNLLPNTGIGKVILILAILLIIRLGIGYRKIKKYKDIK